MSESKYYVPMGSIAGDKAWRNETTGNPWNDPPGTVIVTHQAGLRNEAT